MFVTKNPNDPVTLTFSPDYLHNDWNHKMIQVWSTTIIRFLIFWTNKICLLIVEPFTHHRNLFDKFQVTNEMFGLQPKYFLGVWAHMHGKGPVVHTCGNLNLGNYQKSKENPDSNV